MAGHPHITICRVAYCPKCHANKRAKKGELFVTIGRKRQSYMVRIVTLFGQMGFTPHIIQMQHNIKGYVTYISYCSMEGCGCRLEWNEAYEKYNILPIEWKTFTVTTQEWNQMLLFKDDPTYFLD